MSIAQVVLPIFGGADKITNSPGLNPLVKCKLQCHSARAGGRCVLPVSSEEPRRAEGRCDQYATRPDGRLAVGNGARRGGRRRAEAG